MHHFYTSGIKKKFPNYINLQDVQIVITLDLILLNEKDLIYAIIALLASVH